MEIRFNDLVDCLVRTRDRMKYLEGRIKEVEQQRDAYRDQVDPDWRKRDLDAALAGEARLMRQ